MRHLAWTALVASVATLGGCTAPNPSFNPRDLGLLLGDTGMPAPLDLACARPGACADLLVEPADLSVPDLPPPPDLAEPDLLPPADLAIPKDLFGLDLGPPCGGPNEPCCANAICGKNSFCLQGRCFPCGLVNQSCCLGGVCDGAVCQNALCVPCGGVGEPCCANQKCNGNSCCDGQKNTCVAQNAACSLGDLCKNGACEGCGATGLPCCANQRCNTGCCDGLNVCVGEMAPCAPGKLCTNNACVQSNACGLQGNACCMGGTCLGGQGLCDPNKSQCTTCGGPGQACCNGNDCYAGGCCVAGTCVRSGRTCGAKQICDDGVCSPCGGPAERCCEASTCDGKSCCGLNRTCVTPGSSCGNNCAQMPGKPPVCGTCMMNECQGGNFGMVCGGLGQSCCVTIDVTPNFCVAPGTTCFGPGLPNAGTCVQCGGDKQPCCAGNRCDGGGCCYDGVCHANGGSCGPNMCKNGSCSGGTCGAVGQSCCTGNRCTGPDSICVGGACQPCGGLGERCCTDGASQLALWCAPPYHASGVRFVGQQLVGTCVCN